MSKLAGKVAVVTGASKGIGAAIARRFGAEGAKAIVNYASDKSGAEQVVKDIEAAGSKAVAVKANVANGKDVDLLFAEAKKAFGKVDVLVNNAGVYEFRPLEQIDEQHFRKHFDLNVLGLLLTTKAAVGNINGDGGSIINVSSIASKTPPAGSSVYSATKGAVDVLTRTLAQELTPKACEQCRRTVRTFAATPSLELLSAEWARQTTLPPRLCSWPRTIRVGLPEKRF